MKTSLALLSTLLWSTAFATPITPPQRSSTPPDNEGQSTKSGYAPGVQVDPTAGIGLFGAGTLTGGILAHLATKKHYKNRMADVGDGAPASNPTPEGVKPAMSSSQLVDELRAARVAKEWRQIDQNIDEIIRAEKEGNMNLPGSLEQQLINRLLGYCAEARAVYSTHVTYRDLIERCKEKYGIDEGYPPGDDDGMRLARWGSAIQEQLEDLRQLRKQKVEKESYVVPAENENTGGGNPEKPVQISFAGKRITLPSSLAMDHRQVEQLNQQAQGTIKGWGKSLQNPASLIAPLASSLRSVKTAPKWNPVLH
ncbi:MAG: hypothetical protein M1823_005393 [Watsoniomyces obsoletus]|nr:MAG: hypothetical protein M1823_005393 [Watsoniomyces obsoletus]